MNNEKIADDNKGKNTLDSHNKKLEIQIRKYADFSKSAKKR